MQPLCLRLESVTSSLCYVLCRAGVVNLLTKLCVIVRPRGPAYSIDMAAQPSSGFRLLETA